MIARSLKGKILVFLVFFIGIATGVLMSNFYESRFAQTPTANADPNERATRARSDIQSVHEYLGLNEQQREQVNKILEGTRNSLRQLRRETQPRFEAIQQDSRSKIRALLTEEQREKYDEFRKELQERRSRNRNADRNRFSRPN